jgi:hypothetical protein
MLLEAPTLTDLQLLMTRFSTQHTAALTKRGGVPQEASVYYTFNEDVEPDAFQLLKETGVAFFTVPPAIQSKYRDVRVSGYDVQAYVYPTQNEAANTATIQVSKGGYSTFYPMDTNGNPLTYMHTDIMDSRIYSFVYNPQTCTSISQPCASQTCSNPEFLTVSPYGEWRVQLSGSSLDDMQNVTDLRMVFKVAWHSSNDGKEQNYTDAMFNNDGCDKSDTCFVETTTDLITVEECEWPEELAAPLPSSSGFPAGGTVAIVLFVILAVVGLGFMYYTQHKETDGTKHAARGRHPTTAHNNRAYESNAGEVTLSVGKYHYERGVISRVAAEAELASGSVGAFLVRAKDDGNRVLTVLLREALPDGTSAKFQHNAISQESPTTPLLFNNKTELGFPSHTNIHAAIQYLSTTAGADELGLEVCLVGVIDEDMYGGAVYGTKPQRQASGAYGQSVYASPPATKERCSKCKSRVQFCMCNTTPDDRARARTMTNGSKVNTIAGRARAATATAAAEPSDYEI